jgi:hypothetical protein
MSNYAGLGDLPALMRPRGEPGATRRSDVISTRDMTACAIPRCRCGLIVSGESYLAPRALFTSSSVIIFGS